MNQKLVAPKPPKPPKDLCCAPKQLDYNIQYYEKWCMYDPLHESKCHFTLFIGNKEPLCKQCTARTWAYTGTSLGFAYGQI